MSMKEIMFADHQEINKLVFGPSTCSIMHNPCIPPLGE